MKRAAILCLICLSLVASGCGQGKSKVLEQLGVISAVGYDLVEDDKMLGTFVIPNFTETGAEKIDVLSSTGHTSKELRFNMSRQSERNLVSGQIRAVLYGEELAKKGILPLNDTLFRDAEIGSQIHLAIVEGKAYRFFQQRYPDKPSIDLYLYRLMRKEMEQNTIPKSNLHVFVHDAYSAGKDAVLPYLRLGKEDVVLDGLAIFKKDRFVGKLNAQEARLLAYLDAAKSLGELDVKLQERSSHGNFAHVVMMYLKLKKKVDVQEKEGVPQFKVHLKITGAVTEYSGSKDLEDPKNVKELESMLGKQLKQDIQKVIEKLQTKYGADVAGFGELYRSRGFVNKMTQDSWSKLYAKAKIDVDIKVQIVQTGMIH